MNSAHSPTELALSLIGDVRNLGLICQTETALKDFAERVLTQVKAVDNAAVIETFSGQAFLPLISRLNQEVAPHLQSQDPASDTTQPVHIWVIHHADKLSSEQQSIIFRLIQLFPALPFRVIWLSSTPLPYWKQLTGMGCTVLDLDLSAKVRQKGDLSTQASGAALTNPLQWPAAASTSQPIKTAAAVLGAAMLGSLAWLWASTIGPSPAQTAPPPVATRAPTPAAEMVTTPTPVMVQEPTIKASAETVISAPTNLNKNPPELAQTEVQWLKSLPDDSYVVEHGTFKTSELAQNFQAKHKELSTAHIIALRKTPNAENWQFSLVTAYFRTEERAKRYVSRLEWRASARIRATEKLKPLVVSTP
jgi:hypothetical protein